MYSWSGGSRFPRSSAASGRTEGTIVPSAARALTAHTLDGKAERSHRSPQLLGHESRGHVLLVFGPTREQRQGPHRQRDFPRASRAGRYEERWYSWPAPPMSGAVILGPPDD